MNRLLIGLVVLAVCGSLIAGRLRAQGPTCVVMHDPLGEDTRRYDLSGDTCPLVGTLTVYTKAATDGDGAVVPYIDLALTVPNGETGGLWIPR